MQSGMPPPGESESARLAEFVSTVDLPRTVVVTRGYSLSGADEEEAISNGEIITLHSVQDLQVVRAVDHVGRDTTLPAVGDHKFEVLPDNPLLDKVIYNTFLEMIVDPNMPSKVRVTAAVDTGDDDTIYEDDILEMVTVSGNSQSGQGDQRGIVLTNQFGERLTLPLSTPGKFSSQIDTKWYSMLEILEKFPLPVRVHQIDTSVQSRAAGINKFELLAREVETSILATVNKELIYLPRDCDIEVCTYAAPVTSPPPTISITDSVEHSQEPSPAATPSPAIDVELELLTPTEGLSSSRSSDVFDDSFSEPMPQLTERDRERIRIGSVRRFGSHSNLPQMSELEEEETSRPHRALELIEQLQEKTAETIRLQEWCNKWQAKCQRLESQTQNMRKSMDEAERRAVFWRQESKSKKAITETMLKDMQQYQVTGDKKLLGHENGNDDEFPPFSPFMSKPPPVAAKPDDIHATSLTIDDMQALLKALNMSQYCEVFSEEQIDGGLLMDLPEDSLKSDLGIASQLHRKKLLRSLNGQGPAPLRELISK